jgi:hypothetical protein
MVEGVGTPESTKLTMNRAKHINNPVPGAGPSRLRPARPGARAESPAVAELGSVGGEVISAPVNTCELIIKHEN